MWKTKQLLIHIVFDRRKKNTMEVTEDQQQLGLGLGNPNPNP